MASPMQNRRNIGIIAHIDAGKTTTTERILYFAGTSHRMGDVDDGNTTTDFDPEESQRGITIYSACVTTTWRDSVINIIDTPGHVDFTAEVERSLRVLDGAVVVFSAVEGVEAQSETVWRQADRYNVPRICFINKLDRIGADFTRTFDEISSRLCGDGRTGRHVVAVTIPLSLAGSVDACDSERCIVDLLRRQILKFGPEESNWAVSEEPVPDAISAVVEEWRTKLIDTVCLFDDELMEVFFSAGDLTAEQLRGSVRKATVAGQLVPVYCGTSLKCVGVQPILDGVVDYLPSPLDRPPVTGTALKGKEDPVSVSRAPDPKEPFCGLVFKIVADKHNDLYFVRIYSGTLKSGSRALNPRTGKKELVTQIWHIQADSRERIDQDIAQAGDIVGIVGMKESVTGDTLCDANSPVMLENIRFPERVISMSIEPETSADKDKLELTLKRLSLQDPTFTAKVDQDTGQTIVSGMGELHLEVLKNRMERDFNLKIRVHKPRVTYKETIQSEVAVDGVFDRETSSGHSFASVRLRLVPDSEVSGIKVTREVANQDVPAAFREVLVNAVKDEAQTGLQGFSMTHLAVYITDFRHLPGATNEAAIYAAVAEAFQSAFRQASPAILEPVMHLEVTCPEEFVGPVQSDLNSRHAMVTSSDKRGDLHVIESEVPLAQMFGYSSRLRSITQGRASYSMEPLRYAPASQLPDYM